MDEAEPCVDRQLLRSLPVVLNKEVVVVVDVAAFVKGALLCERLENAKGSIGVAEAAVERVVGGVAEVERTLVRQHPVALRPKVLNFPAELRLEANLDCVVVPDLGQGEV